jgi:hypothetical protein
MDRQWPGGSRELVVIACLYVCSHPELVIWLVNLVIPVVSSSRAHMIRNCKGRIGKLLWQSLSPRLISLRLIMVLNINWPSEQCTLSAVGPPTSKIAKKTSPQPIQFQSQLNTCPFLNTRYFLSSRQPQLKHPNTHFTYIVSKTSF